MGQRFSFSWMIAQHSILLVGLHYDSIYWEVHYQWSRSSKCCTVIRQVELSLIVNFCYPIVVSAAVHQKCPISAFFVKFVRRVVLQSVFSGSLDGGFEFLPDYANDIALMSKGAQAKLGWCSVVWPRVVTIVAGWRGWETAQNQSQWCECYKACPFIALTFKNTKNVLG